MKKEEIKAEFKKVFKSKVFKAIIYCLGFLVIITFAFKIGMYAGLERASFGRNWGDNYSKNFGMMPRGPRSVVENFDNLPNPHGAIGKIIKNDGVSIIVSDDKDKTEKVVLISSDTQIRRMTDNATKDDLIVDTFVIVIGEPNKDGQIEAKLIRIMPSPENMPVVQNNSNIIK